MEASQRLRLSVSKRLALLLLALLMALPLCAKTPLKIMVSPMPIFSTVSNHNTSGYSVSLAKGIVSQAGLDATVETVPFARMKATLDRGEPVLASAFARIPEREDKYYWITPVSANPIAFYVKRDHPLATAASPDFSQISTASVRRSDYRKTLLEDHGVHDIMEVNSWAQAIEAVLKERVDGVLFSSIGMAMMCHEAALDCDELVPAVPWGMTYSYMVIPRTPENARLAAKLTIAASEYKNSPAFAELIDKTLPELRALGVNASESEGVLSFNGPLRPRADDLWVLAAQAPFFSERNASGEVTGYAAELVKAMLAEADLEASLLPAPWSRIAKESKKPNVMAFAVARTPERESMYHWITPVTRSMHGLYGVGKARFASFDAVPKPARVAIIRNDYREQVATDAGFDVYGFDSWTSATSALLADEVDYLFGSRAGITLACRRLIESCDDVNRVAAYRVITTYVVLSKQQTETALVERLKAAAVKVKQDPEFRRWSSAWSQQLNSTNGLRHHIDDGVVQLWSKQEK